MISHNNAPVHTYLIPGTPTAWARPRTSGRMFFDSQKQLKSIWAISLESQKNQQPFYIKTPLLLIAHFYFEPPVSLSPAKREALIGTPYLFKPDLDNLTKLIGDACNAILFDDDCTIVDIQTRKAYDHEARTEFALIPLGPSHVNKGKKK